MAENLRLLTLLSIGPWFTLGCGMSLNPLNPLNPLMKRRDAGLEQYDWNGDARFGTVRHLARLMIPSAVSVYK